jgi:CubicO group peptidase (beta-lactamase class C family)
MGRGIHLALLLMTGVAAGRGLQDPAAPLDPDAVDSVDESFWGSVLVARGEEVLFEKGYGRRDFREKPCTPDTLYDAGSIAKMITAATVLRLVDEGDLSTEDTLSELLGTGAGIAVPEDKADISVLQLLSHTSGFPRGTKGDPDSSAGSRDEGIAAILQQPLATSPGTRFRYSNLNYALLAAIVEIVGRREFAEVVAREVFEPAGMTRSGFVGNRFDGGEPSTRRVLVDGRGKEELVTDFPGPWDRKGATNLLTSVRDLHRFSRVLSDGGFLRPETRERMFTPVLSRYGLGCEVTDLPPYGRCVGHSGVTEGYGSYFAILPEVDLVVVVLSNDRSAARRVATALLGAAWSRVAR